MTQRKEGRIQSIETELKKEGWIENNTAGNDARIKVQTVARKKKKALQLFSM